jgi:hypothetical protein
MNGRFFSFRVGTHKSRRRVKTFVAACRRIDVFHVGRSRYQVFVLVDRQMLRHTIWRNRRKTMMRNGCGSWAHRQSFSCVPEFSISDPVRFGDLWNTVLKYIALSLDLRGARFCRSHFVGTIVFLPNDSTSTVLKEMCRFVMQPAKNQRPSYAHRFLALGCIDSVRDRRWNTWLAAHLWSCFRLCECTNQLSLLALESKHVRRNRCAMWFRSSVVVLRQERNRFKYLPA